jgi:hypothetical protein
MPWHVARTQQCPASKPWGVINNDTGRAENRCHASQEAARRQMAALYNAEPTARSGRMVQSKALQRVEIKNAAKGEVSAVFATLNVVDDDDDVTPNGAFEDGAEVIISSYQHTSWGGALPVGKGTIRETKSEAVLDGQFFMDTQVGRDTFTVVKQLGARQQWSYGYDVLDSDRGTFDGRDVRFLKRLKVHEVSPVLVGSGVNTRTLAVKALMEGGYDAHEATRLVERTMVSEYKAAIRPHETPVVAKAWDAAAAEAAISDDASIAELRSVYAWVDSDGDPEVKASYRFPHHHEPGGAANLRACTTGIAVLNGARGGTSIPESDRRGVYNHLAGHLQDGDREPPELRAGGDTSSMKFTDEAAAVMAGVSALLDRASDVMALRAAKGKSLASASIDLLEWLYDDLRRLRTVLDSPQDDAAREYVRYVHSLQHQESA